MDYYHTQLMHDGVQRTYQALTENYYWPNMMPEVTSFVRQCKTCASVKVTGTAHVGKHQTFYADRPFEIVHMDLVGPLPTTDEGYKYILTMMDSFSGIIQAIPLYESSSNEVCDAILQYWIPYYGRMDIILTDNGGQFRGDLMTALRTLFGIKALFTTEYHPQTNGQLERWHRYPKQNGWTKDERNGPKMRETYFKIMVFMITFMNYKDDYYVFRTKCEHIKRNKQKLGQNGQICEERIILPIYTMWCIDLLVSQN